MRCATCKDPIRFWQKKSWGGQSHERCFVAFNKGREEATTEADAELKAVMLPSIYELKQMRLAREAGSK